MSKPGTELKSLIQWVAKPSPNCDCQTYADAMDLLGPEWCRANLETITDWLMTEAANRGWPTGPMTRFAAGRLVRRAIKNAERNAAGL